MFNTRAVRLRTVGAAVAVLASSSALFGVVGLAKADTGLPSVYCYKNPSGTQNPDRIYVSRVVYTDPDSNGDRALTWRTEVEYWADALHAYANPTSTWQDHVTRPIQQSSVDYTVNTPDAECLQLAGDGYVHGEW